MFDDPFVEHFCNPRNVGRIEDPDGYGQAGSLECGDLTEITIRVLDGIIADIAYRTFGCSAAIASGSMATELVKGRTLDEAMALTQDEIADALGGLSEAKLHCSVMAADAVREAIRNYFDTHPDAERAG
jgi:nitrogen fixation NifU-like protein